MNVLEEIQRDYKNHFGYDMTNGPKQRCNVEQYLYWTKEHNKIQKILSNGFDGQDCSVLKSPSENIYLYQKLFYIQHFTTMFFELVNGGEEAKQKYMKLVNKSK